VIFIEYQLKRLYNSYIQCLLTIDRKGVIYVIICPICGKTSEADNVKICDICNWNFTEDLTANYDPESITPENIALYEKNILKRRNTYIRHSNENMFSLLEEKLTDEDINSLSAEALKELYDRLPEKQGISMLRRLKDDKIKKIKLIDDIDFQSVRNGLEHLKREEVHVVLNNNGNVVNDGLVAQSGEWIYFHNTNDKGCIYKMRNDGGELQRVNYFESFYINTAGNFIYYSNGNDSCKIYRIQTDGKNNHRLNNDLSCYLNVSGDWIYYSNRSDRYKLYKMKTDGTHRQKINDDGSREINVINNWIYYQNYRDGDKIYRIRTDGTERQKLNDDDSSYINVNNGWIYYKNGDDNNSIYKITVDGNDKQKINKDKSYYINVSGDWIYYRNYDDNSFIYKIKTDGTKRKQINNEDSGFINITDDWIFYKNYKDENRMYKVRQDGKLWQRI
jgi:uncharacterized protein YchJ